MSKKLVSFLNSLSYLLTTPSTILCWMENDGELNASLFAAVHRACDIGECVVTHVTDV